MGVGVDNLVPEHCHRPRSSLPNLLSDPIPPVHRRFRLRQATAANNERRPSRKGSAWDKILYGVYFTGKVSLRGVGDCSSVIRWYIGRHGMTQKQLLARVRVDPEICAGRPYIRGTHIYIAIILDALTQGYAPEEIIDHYPCLDLDDIHAAVVYASQLAQQNCGVALLNQHRFNHLQIR
jgi:uncharacterized protein (DUF433 family)